MGILAVQCIESPTGSNMCIQYVFLLDTSVMISEKTANVSVTAIFPLMFAAAGNSPSKLPNQMKKNKVNMYGKYFSYRGPIFGFTISSRNKNNNWLKKRLNSFRRLSFIFSYTSRFTAKKPTARLQH